MNELPRKITTKENLHAAILKGVNAVGDIVGKTLGARGRNILIPRPYGISHVTKDGVTTAREIFLEDPLENQFAQLVVSAASEANAEVGDSTTTTTILTQEIVKEGIKNVVAGSNPMDIKKGIDMAVKYVAKQLKEMAVDVKQDSKQITQIATISANGNKEIGKLIGDAFREVGSEGVVATENSKTNQTYMDIVEGLEVEAGLISPHFITDFQKQEAVFTNPYIYIADESIQTLAQIQEILQFAMSKTRPLVFIANKIENEALSTLIINALPPQDSKKRRYPFAAIESVGFGEDRSLFLEDIATVIGADVISDTKGMSFEKASEITLGTCEKITISRKRTTIIKGGGDKKKIKERAKSLRLEIKGEKEPMKERVLVHRLAKLSGGVAILSVGANSEVELKEKKDLIEDAINSVRSASKEGIVMGGGMAFIKILKSLKENVTSDRPDVITGINIIYRAIKRPFNQIILNGEGSPDVVLNEVLKRGGNIGYDVYNETYVDMFKSGIIDPAMAMRVALEKSSSVAGLILTTEGALTEIKTPE